MKQRGMTLLELMMVVAILGILAGLALPSYQDAIERNRIKQAAEALKSDIQWMRTESIKRSCNLNASFTTATWKYTIFRTAATCPSCSSGNCVDKEIFGTSFPGITMNSATFLDGAGAASSLIYDFRRGTTVSDTSGSVRFNSTNYSLKVAVTLSGQVKICNISGSRGLPAYPTC